MAREYLWHRSLLNRVDRSGKGGRMGLDERRAAHLFQLGIP